MENENKNEEDLKLEEIVFMHQMKVNWMKHRGITEDWRLRETKFIGRKNKSLFGLVATCSAPEYDASHIGRMYDSVYLIKKMGEDWSCKYILSANLITYLPEEVKITKNEIKMKICDSLYKYNYNGHFNVDKYYEVSCDCEKDFRPLQDRISSLPK